MSGTRQWIVDIWQEMLDTQMLEEEHGAVLDKEVGEAQVRVQRNL